MAPDRRPDRTRLGLLLAAAAPALLAAGAVVLTGHGDGARVDHPKPPAALARLAGMPTEDAALGTPLRPVAARPGEAELGAERLESPAGGIRPAPPARIAIPAAGVDAPVQPVATVDDTLETPPVGRAGWFDGGARPGEPGRAVLIGHLDSRDGPGLFARVPNLPPGTPIAVTDRRGQVHRFRAVGGSQVKKEDFPAAYVYGHSDRPALVLITCGGPYEKGGGYRDNVLLYARAA